MVHTLIFQVRTKGVTTGAEPVTFTFDGLDGTETYVLAACMFANGRPSCGPKIAACDMTTQVWNLIIFVMIKFFFF